MENVFLSFAGNPSFVENGSFPGMLNIFNTNEKSCLLMKTVIHNFTTYVLTLIIYDNAYHFHIFCMTPITYVVNTVFFKPVHSVVSDD